MPKMPRIEFLRARPAGCEKRERDTKIIIEQKGNNRYVKENFFYFINKEWLDRYKIKTRVFSFCVLSCCFCCCCCCFIGGGAAKICVCCVHVVLTYTYCTYRTEFRSVQTSIFITSAAAGWGTFQRSKLSAEDRGQL